MITRVDRETERGGALETLKRMRAEERRRLQRGELVRVKTDRGYIMTTRPEEWHERLALRPSWAKPNVKEACKPRRYKVDMR